MEELDDNKDILDDLEEAGGKVEGLEEVDNEVEVLGDVGDTWKLQSADFSLIVGHNTLEG